MEFSKQEYQSGYAIPFSKGSSWPRDRTLVSHISDRFFIIHKDAAAAAAKSLQSCPTLCDPIDGSPPGSAIPGILQARTLEWVAISFSNAWKWKVKVKDNQTQISKFKQTLKSNHRVHTVVHIKH